MDCFRIQHMYITNSRNVKYMMSRVLCGKGVHNIDADCMVPYYAKSHSHRRRIIIPMNSVVASCTDMKKAILR